MSLREPGLCATGRATLDAVLAGERNPRSLADRAEGNLVKKKPALTEALTGQFEDTHGWYGYCRAPSSAHTDTFLGACYRSIAKHRGRAKAPAGRRPGRRKRHLRATFLHTSRSRLMPGLLTDTGS
ncbi:hypothetical protein [Streptomyces mirabilis]|uniref:hypothetical protein n=1 Tax=Streptomyces mirabilis TaxID=68239 RepID=UPI00324B401D